MEINSINPDEQHQLVGLSACTGPIPNANSNDSISSNGGNETEGCPPTMPQPLEPESKDKKINRFIYYIRLCVCKITGMYHISAPQIGHLE